MREVIGSVTMIGEELMQVESIKIATTQKYLMSKQGCRCEP
jgi:hypothetical protein